MAPHKSRRRKQEKKFVREEKIFKKFKDVTDWTTGKGNGVKILRLEKTRCKKKRKKKTLDQKDALSTVELSPKRYQLRSLTSARNKATTGPETRQQLAQKQGNNWPRNKATTGPETRQQLAQKQGNNWPRNKATTGPKTRQQLAQKQGNNWPRNKATTGPVKLFYSGSHETQVCPRGEAHLHKHFSLCTKNPGHKQFIPIDIFSLTHLPKRYRHPYLYKVIRLLADLTVRLAVTWTSTERPDFYPESDIPYPFSEIRGRHVMKLGTGRVQEIIRYTEKEKKLCPCCQVNPSRSPCKLWGEIEVVTATHVVFDDSEARKTSCRLFFDNQSSPNLTLQGVRVVGADLEKDLCWLVLATCDVVLLNKLQKLKDRFLYWWSRVYDDYWDLRDEARLAVIVSHPHGCPKHVSVGRWTERSEVGDYDYKYTYTTATCEGSSGACVYLLGIDGWLYYEHTHSGTLSKHENFSGAGRDYFRYIENTNDKYI